MRTRTARVTAIVLVVLAAACGHVWSIHPLFGKGDLLREPALAGIWRDSSRPGGERWVLMQASGSEPSYLLVSADSAVAGALSRIDLEALFADDSATKATLRRDAPARARRARDSAVVYRLRSDARGPRWFSVGLGRLGGTLFADIAPENFTDLDPRLGKSFFVSTHWFWKVAVEGRKLRITPLDEDWLLKMIDSGTVRIAHDSAEGGIMLTAPTAELQRLVTRCSGDTLAFPSKRQAVYIRIQ